MKYKTTAAFTKSASAQILLMQWSYVLNFNIKNKRMALPFFCSPTHLKTKTSSLISNQRSLFKFLNFKTNYSETILLICGSAFSVFASFLIFATNAFVSLKGGTPLYLATFPGPALKAARAKSTEPNFLYIC